MNYKIILMKSCQVFGWRASLLTKCDGVKSKNLFGLIYTFFLKNYITEYKIYTVFFFFFMTI